MTTRDCESSDFCVNEIQKKIIILKEHVIIWCVSIYCANSTTTKILMYLYNHDQRCSGDIMLGPVKQYYNLNAYLRCFSENVTQHNQTVHNLKHQY